MPVRRLVATMVAGVLFAACSASANPTAGPVVLRLGYFPNVTHAPALVGVEKGIFAKAPRRRRQARDARPSTPAPAAIEALFAERLDATYIGPNPAINAFAKSDGEAIRIVSGATSGGAFLVVKPDINSRRRPQGQDARHAPARQHAGRRPALLAEGPGPQDRRRRAAATCRSCRRRTRRRSTRSRPATIDGAWVPEPWATRLIQEGGGKVLVDERDLWPDGQYVTTHLIVAHRVPRRRTPTWSRS